MAGSEQLSWRVLGNPARQCTYRCGRKLTLADIRHHFRVGVNGKPGPLEIECVTCWNKRMGRAA